MTLSSSDQAVMNGFLRPFTSGQTLEKPRQDINPNGLKNKLEKPPAENSFSTEYNALEERLKKLHAKLNMQVSHLQENAKGNCQDSLTKDSAISVSNLAKSLKESLEVVCNEGIYEDSTKENSIFFHIPVFFSSIISALAFYLSESSALVCNLNISSQKTENEKIQEIINYLTARKAITPKEREDILKSLNNQLGNIESNLSRFANILKISIVDINDILDECVKRKAYTEAFRILKTIWQINHVVTSTEAIKNISLTSDEIRTLKSASLFSTKQLDEIHDIIDRLEARSILFKWLDQLPTTLSASIETDLLNTCKKAIIENDQNLFIDTIEVAIQSAKKTSSEITLETMYAQELVESLRILQKTSSKFFVDLAQGVVNDCYVSTFITEIKELKHSLKLFADNISSKNQINFLPSFDEEMKVNAILEKISLLIEPSQENKAIYGNLLGKNVSHLLSPITTKPLSETFKSAQIGKLTRVLRKISDLKERLHKNIFHNDRRSTQKSGLYQTKLQRLEYDGLPVQNEKIHELSEKIDMLSLESNQDNRGRDIISCANKTAHVALLKCSYGNGHESYTRSVENSLQVDYNDSTSLQRLSSVQFDVPDDLLKEHDLLYKLTQGKWTTKDLFNWSLQTDRCWIIDMLKKLAGGGTHVDKETATLSARESIILRKILENGTDAVGMFYTFDKDEIVKVAHTLGVPLIHGATDFDVSGWYEGTNHPVFKFLIPSKTNSVVLGTLPDKLNSSQVEEIGIVVREPFRKILTQEDVERSKEKLQIDKDATVITFSSGGGGMSSALPELLAQAAEKFDKKLHIFVVTGNNEAYKKHIEEHVAATNSSQNLKITATGFLGAHDYHELMSVSDFFCGKPGGQTTSEIIANNECRKRAGLTPLTFMYDITSHRFDWEKINASVTENLGIGVPVTANEEFINLLQQEMNRETSRTFESLTTKDDEEMSIDGDHELSGRELQCFGTKQYPQIFKSAIAEAKNNDDLKEKRKNWKKMVNTFSKNAEIIL